MISNSQLSAHPHLRCPSYNLLYTGVPDIPISDAPTSSVSSVCAQVSQFLSVALGAESAPLEGVEGVGQLAGKDAKEGAQTEAGPAGPPAALKTANSGTIKEYSD